MKLITTYDPFYPDDDGEPMSDNTLQAEWLYTLFGNLDVLFRNDANVFVAGNHLIYAVKGDNKTRVAPDVYVAFGRPKGHRGSYKVWDEGGIFPQVVFEVMSPGNRPGEMATKLAFYDRFGAREYYIYDPDDNEFLIYTRNHDDRFSRIPEPSPFVSPLLNNYFELGDELMVSHPDGSPFLTFQQQRDEMAAAKLLADSQRGHAFTPRRVRDPPGR